MLLRTLILGLLLATATGCSTIKGWFGSSKNAAAEPAELVDIASPIRTKPAWSVNLGDNRERQGLRQVPAIEADRLYVSDDAGNVLAIDGNTGKTLWKAPAVEVGRQGSRLIFWRSKVIEGGLAGGPGVGNGLVVVGGRNGEVVALDAETGDKRWTARVTSEVIATPLVLPDRIVVRSNDGRTFGLDPADGSRKWVFDRGIPTLSVRGNGSPVAAGELVFLGYDDGSVVALRARDGLQAWEQLVTEPDGRNELERMADVDGEIQAGYDAVFASSFKGRTAAIAPANGRPIWNRDVGGYGGIALLADKLVLSDKEGNVWALDRATGNSLWKQDGLARRWLTTPAIQGNYAVVGDLDGYLHWINLEDGRIVGRDRVERSVILSTPQVAPSGMLYVLTAEGKLAAYPQPE